MLPWKLTAAIGAGLCLAFLTIRAARVPDHDQVIVPKKTLAAINKMADAIAKGQKVDTDAEGFYKANKNDLRTAMWVFKPRGSNGKGGLGIGKKPGLYTPDGIEVFIFKQTGHGKPMTKEELKAAAPDLNRLADVTCAVAELTYQYTPKNKVGEKDPKIWTKAADDLKKSAQDLKVVIKANKPEDLKKAFTMLCSSCNACHTVFRNEEDGAPVVPNEIPDVINNPLFREAEEEVIVVPKEIRAAVTTMADAVAKGEKIDQPADTFFKDHRGGLKKAMWIFNLPVKDDKGSFVTAGKPGVYAPDSIGALISLRGDRAAKSMTENQLKAGAEELKRLADITTVMAGVTQRYKPKNIIIGRPNGVAAPKDWMEAVDNMKNGAQDLKTAIGANKPDDARKAFTMLYSSCNACHTKFRD